MTIKKPTNMKYFILLLLFIFCSLFFTKEVKTNSSSAFILSQSSKPYNNNYVNYSTYNKRTKQYYVLRSYLEQLEKAGGGSLTLKAGTYEICNTLYVPSHVVINLEDGVIIKKTQETGTSKLKNSKSIFQLVAPSKAKMDGAYGEYNGESGIKLTGNGNVIMDLNYIQDSIAIILGHNTNITISGITFQNMYSGHFIEMDASSNVIIQNNKFVHHKKSISGIKEAINIDTPDNNTEGFHVIWTKHDATPNKDILILNNNFNDLERSIGTHKYSENKYHDNIQIINNKISNTSSDAIRIMNWSKPVIKNNIINMVADGKGTCRAILASGMIHPIITDNTFMDVSRPIQIMPWKNSGPGSQYETTYNDLNREDINLMLQNKVIRAKEYFIRENLLYGVFDSTNTNKYYLAMR